VGAAVPVTAGGAVVVAEVVVIVGVTVGVLVADVGRAVIADMGVEPVI